MSFIDAQIAVVTAAVACFPAGAWQAAILDYEILEFEDGFDTDYVGIILVAGSDGALRQEQFYLDRAAREACTALYQQRKREAGETMAGFVLRIAASGAYQFSFKDKVRRLDGIWDAEAEGYLERYLEQYLREQSDSAG